MQLKYTLKEELTPENINNKMQTFLIKGVAHLTVNSVMQLGFATDRELVNEYVSSLAENQETVARLVNKVSKLPFDLFNHKWVRYFTDELQDYEGGYEELEKFLNERLQTA